VLDVLVDYPGVVYLAALRPRGSVDWMVHPGFYDESLIGRDSYINGRVLELAALTSPPISVEQAGAFCDPADGVTIATIGDSKSAYDHSADHRLSLVRNEEPSRPGPN
jgi:hypothetical protein